jgi:hypothetical protein
MASETYNWSSFYNTLCQQGPNLLLGIDDNLRELIEVAGSSTDIFWSDGLQERLAEGAANGSVRAGVLSALDLWRNNVLETLDVDFGIELEWQSVRLDTASPLIDKLVDAATP